MSDPMPVVSAEVVEGLARVLAAHNIECTGIGEVTCRGCRDLSWMTWADYRTHVATALLASPEFAAVLGEEWDAGHGVGWMDCVRSEEATSRGLREPDQTANPYPGAAS